MGLLPPFAAQTTNADEALSALAALATIAGFLLEVACVIYRWRREHMRERMWREVTEKKGTEKNNTAGSSSSRPSTATPVQVS